MLTSAQLRRGVGMKLEEAADSIDSLISNLSSDSENSVRGPQSITIKTYASHSILLNPLPPKPDQIIIGKKLKPTTTCLIAHKSCSLNQFKLQHADQHTLRAPLHRTISSISTNSNLTTINDNGENDDALSTTSCNLNDASSYTTSASGALSFAPLPPGRSRYRSNSLTIGVAARAQMIASQGGGAQVRAPRFSGPIGPQQWYQPDAPLPPDVYTYKDATRGISKVWKKLRGKSSSSEAVAAALATEKEGKAGGEADEERIEDIHELEEHHEEDFIKPINLEDRQSSIESSASDGPSTPIDSTLDLLNINKTSNDSADLNSTSIQVSSL